MALQRQISHNSDFLSGDKRRAPTPNFTEIGQNISNSRDYFTPLLKYNSHRADLHKTQQFDNSLLRISTPNFMKIRGIVLTLILCYRWTNKRGHHITRPGCLWSSISDRTASRIFMKIGIGFTKKKKKVQQAWVFWKPSQLKSYSTQGCTETSIRALHIC